MKILILGASGIAGRKIYDKLRENHEVMGTCRQSRGLASDGSRLVRLDLADVDRVSGLLDEAKPDVIVSCVGGEFQVQYRAHEIMADYCGRRRARFIFFSSANVFDGDDSRVHYEGDPVCAESEYGKFKIDCERLLQETLGERSAILRFPFIWSREKGGRTDRMLQRIRQGEPIQMWERLYTNHATDEQAASFVRYLIQEGRGGIFHVGTRDVCEYLPFVERLLQGFAVSNYTFHIEESDTPCHMAVLPGQRAGDTPPAPKELYSTCGQVLDWLCRKEA